MPERKLTVGSLFSGIGGIELGLTRTQGFEVRWQVEINEYARGILAKHWPTAVRYADITQVDFAAVEPIDVLVGGFPCQDISIAGRGAGIREGTRSGLWSEYLRAIRTIRPRYAVVENVPALLYRGLDQVLGDLAQIGYDAKWGVLSAAQFGAPHLRERIFIVAYPGSQSNSVVSEHPFDRWQDKAEQSGLGSECDTANANGERCAECLTTSEPGRPGRPGWYIDQARAERLHQSGLGGSPDGVPSRLARLNAWLPGWEGDTPRVVPKLNKHLSSKLRGYGNAVVPQVAQYVGEMVLEMERQWKQQQQG